MGEKESHPNCLSWDGECLHSYGLTMKRENDVGGIKTLPDHPDEGGDLNQHITLNSYVSLLGYKGRENVNK